MLTPDHRVPRPAGRGRATAHRPRRPVSDVPRNTDAGPYGYGVTFRIAPASMRSCMPVTYRDSSDAR